MPIAVLASVGSGEYRLYSLCFLPAWHHLPVVPLVARRSAQSSRPACKFSFCFVFFVLFGFLCLCFLFCWCFWSLFCVFCVWVFWFYFVFWLFSLILIGSILPLSEAREERLCFKFLGETIFGMTMLQIYRRNHCLDDYASNF